MNQKFRSKTAGGEAARFTRIVRKVSQLPLNRQVRIESMIDVLIDLAPDPDGVADLVLALLDNWIEILWVILEHRKRGSEP